MSNDDNKFAEWRAALIDEIEAETLETRQYLGKDTLDPRVIAAMGTVPREAFVPESVRDLAYVNRPLSIGHGQTISQPYIVAVMTDLLGLGPESRVLEIGTGCGYQTAVLAEVAAAVYTVEVIAPLAAAARDRLLGLGYESIHFLTGDGRLGWPEHAPYDGIIVTAAAAQRPDALLGQLRDGGRMVVPIGRQHCTQFLTRIVKEADGRINESPLLPVSFVPLVGRG